VVEPQELVVRIAFSPCSLTSSTRQQAGLDLSCGPHRARSPFLEVSVAVLTPNPLAREAALAFARKRC